jgi:hypothetical protein
MLSYFYHPSFALCCGIVLSGLAFAETPVISAERAAQWEPDMAAFEKADAATPPKKEGILFLGSSSIRMWDVERWFPDMGALNRGFGGSEIADSIHFADRIVFPYAPKVIVFYAGDNDIAGGKKAGRVIEDFRAFTKKVREKLPETRIIYIAIKPSIARWNLIDEIRAANRGISGVCNTEERLDFVDIDTPMLGEDGKPRPALLREDGLHLSEGGCALWTKMVMPLLVKEDNNG